MWSLAGRGAGDIKMRLRYDWRPGVSVFINDKSGGKCEETALVFERRLFERSAALHVRYYLMYVAPTWRPPSIARSQLGVAESRQCHSVDVTEQLCDVRTSVWSGNTGRRP